MLTRLYRRFDGRFSDLWLRSADGAIFAVHRLVVCVQSDVISKLLVDSESESHEQRIIDITLPKSVVEALIDYMYTEDYSDNVQIMLHCQIYVAAHSFRIKGLKSLAFEKISRLLQDDWSTQQPFLCRIIEYIWSHGPDQDTRLRPLLLDLSRNHFEKPWVDSSFPEDLNRIDELMGDWANFLGHYLGSMQG